MSVFSTIDVAASLCTDATRSRHKSSQIGRRIDGLNRVGFTSLE